MKLQQKTILSAKLFLEMIEEAWISLKSYKLRTFLTTLGIIIGVSAVVIMVSIGEATERKIQQDFAKIGANLIYVTNNWKKVAGISNSSFARLSTNDADAIKLLYSVSGVSYSINTSGTVIYSNSNISTSVVGASASFFETNNEIAEKGEVFDESLAKENQLVAVLGAKVATDIFGDDNPIGQVIRYRDIPMLVIGVLKSKGEGASRSDQRIITPYKAFTSRIFMPSLPNYVSEIQVNSKTPDSATLTETQITNLLRLRHNIPSGTSDTFRIFNQQEIINSAKSVSNTIAILLSAIASISLLVGGIGIMNMMLVSVTERTREVGIRKAVGAKESTILFQFLMESIVISLFGSIIGLILGLTLSQVASFFIGLSIPISVSAVIWSIAVSVIIGIGSGIIPARKAAKLSPIEAFRYE